MALKRSATIRLVLMGAAALSLTACEDEVPAGVFETAEQCITSGQYDRTRCEAAFAEAQQEHQRVAPRFASRAECEEEFGAQKCQPAPETAQSGGSGFFMPLMAGYMLGNLMRGPGYFSQPLYRQPGAGQTFYGAGGSPVATGTGQTRVAESAIRSQPTAIGNVQRGGFGSQARSYGSTSS
jgi:uncharacterized protein YgiB involved in biofilm formation